MSDTAQKLEPPTVLRKQINFDAWANFFTGVGAIGQDKSLEARIENRLVSQDEAEEFWEADHLAATVIEKVPREMFREGFLLEVESGNPGTPSATDGTRDRKDFVVSPSLALPAPEQEAVKSDGHRIAEDTLAVCDEMELVSAFIEADEYRRAYGGSAIFLGVNDGQRSLDMPLREDRIFSFDFVDVLTPRECRPIEWYRDPLKSNYGKPKVFLMRRDAEGDFPAEDGVRVHESRLITFQGVVVSRKQLRRNGGWGNSVLVRVGHVIRDFQMGYSNAAVLLSDFAQAVFGIEGLAEAVMQDDAQFVMERLRLLNMSRSTLRALAIDKNETFKREATPLSGYPEMLDKFAQNLASASDTPVTILMGQSPAGLNATGASDIRAWYDTISADRQKRMTPRMNRALKVLFLAKRGPTRGKEPDNWMVKWPALWQLTEQEEADLRNKQANTDKAYVDAGVLMPEEVAISRFGGDGYSIETKLDRGVREEADAAQQKEATQRAAELQAAAKAPPNGKVAAPGAPPGARGDNFDPNQPRDNTGKWGEGGSSSGGAVPVGGHGTAPEDIRARLAVVSPESFSAVITDLGGDPSVARNMTEKYVESANHPVAIGMRAAAIEAMADGDPVLREKLLDQEKGTLSSYAHAVGRDAEIASLHSHLVADAPAVQTFKAVAVASQAMHDDETVLLRGLYGAQAVEIKAAISRGEAVRVPVNVASSFTDDPTVAEAYARGRGMPKGSPVPEHSVVIKIRAPRSAIAVSYRAEPSLSNAEEHEVIVASHGQVNVAPADVTILR